MIIGIYNLPLAISLMGLVLSLSTIYLSAQGKFNYAMVCLIFAGIADLFDGMVARKLKSTETERSFGLHVDSIIDVVSFGAAPVVFFLNFGMNGLLDYALFTIYVVCAVIRLAYFNVNGLTETGSKKYYTGLPVTYVALIFPLLFVLSRFMPVAYFKHVIQAGFLLISMLFIVRIPVPKPGGVFYVLFPVLAVAASVYFLAI